MTESEWQHGADLIRLVEGFEPSLSERRARLLAAAFCRAAHGSANLPELLQTMAIIERFCDGGATVQELQEARQRCRVMAIQENEDAARATALEKEVGLDAILRSRLAWALAYATTTPVSLTAVTLHLLEARETPPADGLPATCRQRLLDVVGNSFARIEFSPAWRTSTAVALASRIYESQDYSTMPILADALQDAGCDREEVLSHCRDAGAVHIRGCWAVDCVLDLE